jgi:hypothetical protein
MVSVADMAQHVDDLCPKTGIRFFVKRWHRPCQSWCCSKTRLVRAAPIKSDISYAAALHEIGHLEGRHQQSRHEIVCERWAWEWARRNAIIWTPRMERLSREAVASYEREVRAGRGVVYGDADSAAGT